MSEPFRKLEPPSGGLQGLRERVADYEQSMKVRRGVAYAMAAMCCIAIGLLLWARWGVSQGGGGPQQSAAYAQWLNEHPALSLAKSPQSSSSTVSSPQASQIVVEQVTRQGSITYYRVGVVDQSVVSESVP